LLALAAVSLHAADVAGDWEMTTSGGRSRGGSQTRPFTIVQDGEKITVTMEGRMGEMTGEGTCMGNEIEWTVTMETPRGDFTLVYRGTVDGDTMSGTVTMGERGSREWTAKRKS
jgi:hypothetical protein